MYVETEFEALMERLVPGCRQHWEGATPAAIDELEQFVGQPLPAFYRWFLARMGRDMGPLAIPRRDMRIGTVLSIYRRGLKLPEGLVLIASEEDEQMPMYMFCDLNVPMRDDALVCSGEKVGGPLQLEFETLRERMAWCIFSVTRLKDHFRCGGSFDDQDCDVLTKLAPALAQLGFETLHQSGPRCGLYARGDTSLRCSGPGGGELPPYLFFEIAGEEHVIRSVLGYIATETSLDVEITRWLSPLNLPMTR